MKNINIPGKFLKFGEFQRKGHNEKEVDPRQITNIASSEKVIYLTFDMCPTKELNEDLIQWLIDEGHEATFFVCVDWIKQNRNRNLEFLNHSKFSIGGHGFHHVDTLEQSDDEQSDDIRLACEWWESEMGKKIKWYRVPFGHPTEVTFQELKKRGMKCASWSGPVFDKVAKGISVNLNELAELYIQNQLKSGDIWIMHANGEGKNTFDLLKSFTSKIQKKGYSYRKLN